MNLNFWKLTYKWYVIILLSCLLVIGVTRRRWFSWNVYWTHSWVSVFQGLRPRFILSNNSCSRGVENFVCDIFTKSSVYLAWKASCSSPNLLFWVFMSDVNISVTFLKSSIHFLVSHHVHTGCLHVHVWQIEVACPHTDHWSCSPLRIDAFVNLLIVFTGPSSCQESFEKWFFWNTVKNSARDARRSSSSVIIFIDSSCRCVSTAPKISLDGENKNNIIRILTVGKIPLLAD